MEVESDIQDGLSSNLVAMAKKQPQVISIALLELGGEILRVADDHVPFKEGILKGSGSVGEFDESNYTRQVGYHTPYAARLHEHPEYNFEGSGEGKFLENPIKTHMSDWLPVIANKIKEGLGI